jgi:formylglycine-generating enzyme required for sulfatase activity
MRTLLVMFVFCGVSWVSWGSAQETDLEHPKEITNSIGMKLVLIPKGTFMMGSPENEAGREKSEVERQHEVTLSRDYFLGVYEVTQEQYEQVVGTNPSKFKGPSNPVEMVSWEDAVEFCKRLSDLPEEKTAGRVYRLPTEAEWEYACRAGSTTKYSFGDDEGQLGDNAWFGENRGGTPHPVGKKKPNAWGLYDMHGNVWEWCADWLGPYPDGAISDPTGLAGNPPARVLRGGCWYDGAARCRAASRAPGGRPMSHSSATGFRVALGSSGIPK